MATDEGSEVAGGSPPTIDRDRTLLLEAEAQHRMKTSVAVIAGWAATLEDRWGELDDVGRRQGVAVIRRTADELLAQTRALLEGAAAELRSSRMAPVPLDLAEVLEVTASTFGALSTGHAVQHVDVEGPVTVEVDPASLQQVLGHLVENAVKYAPLGTDVQLRARSLGRDWAELEVADRGPGLPEEVDVFEPFVRGAGTGPVPGAGLGLHVVRTLVEAMGGRVRTGSRPGGGTVFRVILPVRAGRTDHDEQDVGPALMVEGP